MFMFLSVIINMKESDRIMTATKIILFLHINYIMWMCVYQSVQEKMLNDGCKKNRIYCTILKLALRKQEMTSI